MSDQFWMFQPYSFWGGVLFLNDRVTAHQSDPLFFFCAIKVCCPFSFGGGYFHRESSKMDNVAWMFSTSREGGPIKSHGHQSSHLRSLVSSSTSLVLPFCSPLHLPSPGWSPRGHTLSPVLSEGFCIPSAWQTVVPWGVQGATGGWDRRDTYSMLSASGQNWKRVGDKTCVRARTWSARIATEMLFPGLHSCRSHCGRSSRTICLSSLFNLTQVWFFRARISYWNNQLLWLPSCRYTGLRSDRLSLSTLIIVLYFGVTLPLFPLGFQYW